MSCKIYHGCMLKNIDGTNKIVDSTEKCIVPTDKCMWKLPIDVPNGVKLKLNQLSVMRKLTITFLQNISFIS